MAPTQTPTNRAAQSVRSVLVSQYGGFGTWHEPAASASPEPPAPPVARRRGYWLAVLALGLVTLLLWPLQIVVAAVVLGSAWLIDSSLRDVVPGHARTVRHALAPVPWVLAVLGTAATFVWPAGTTGLALVFLGVATGLYLGCEAVVMFRDR